jgi:dTDP-4-amino-4,6-dideoxygalactose transaminase
MNGQSEGAWYYQQLRLGFNYRMTDFQAALGASQLLRLETYVNRRRELALRYDLKLTGLNLRIPWQHPDTLSAFHLYVIRCEETSRQKVFEFMRNSGIGVNVHYIPVHLHPYYQKLGFLTGDFPSAEAYYKEAITIPLFPVMSDEDQLIVVDVLAEALSRTSIK